jgi:hypothetical protein
MKRKSVQMRSHTSIQTERGVCREEVQRVSVTGEGEGHRERTKEESVERGEDTMRRSVNEAHNLLKLAESDG